MPSHAAQDGTDRGSKDYVVRRRSTVLRSTALEQVLDTQGWRADLPLQAERMRHDGFLVVTAGVYGLVPGAHQTVEYITHACQPS